MFLEEGSVELREVLEVAVGEFEDALGVLVEPDGVVVLGLQHGEVRLSDLFELRQPPLLVNGLQRDAPHQPVDPLTHGHEAGHLAVPHRELVVVLAVRPEALLEPYFTSRLEQQIFSALYLHNLIY